MTKKEFISKIWHNMDNLMYKYITNISKSEKKAIVTEIFSLFYNREMYKYYMYKGERALGQTNSMQIISNELSFKNELADAINDKYNETIIDTIKKYNGSVNYSKFFNYIFKRRIKDKNIINILTKYKKFYSLDEPVKSKDGDSTIRGDIIEGNINHRAETSNDLRDGIDDLAEMLLLMMCIIKVKTRSAKNDYNKIYEKIYTSDFCNTICKNAEFTDYISNTLLRREKIIFEFMDLKFMDFFMCNNNRNIKSISKDKTKTEKEISISESELRLNLPIEQKIYRFYYENILNDKETSIRHRFDKYKEIITNIRNSYRNNRLEENDNDIIISDENYIRTFITRYVDGNYRNSKNLK